MTATIIKGVDQFDVLYDFSTEDVLMESMVHTGVPLSCTKEDYHKLQSIVAQPDSWKLFPPFCNSNEDEDTEEIEIIVKGNTSYVGKSDSEEETTSETPIFDIIVLIVLWGKWLFKYPALCACVCAAGKYAPSFIGMGSGLSPPFLYYKAQAPPFSIRKLND